MRHRDHEHMRLRAALQKNGKLLLFFKHSVSSTEVTLL